MRAVRALAVALAVVMLCLLPGCSADLVLEPIYALRDLVRFIAWLFGFLVNLLSGDPTRQRRSLLGCILWIAGSLFMLISLWWFTR